MIEEYQMHQLRHKRIPLDIEFYDEHGTPVTYQIQHEDNPNDTCNDFYPIKYKCGNEEKMLILRNDGEDLTVSSMLDEFPITSIQQASDCFRMGRFIDQFRQVCGPKIQSNASVDTSNNEYSSINSLSPSEDDEADPTSPGDDLNHVSTDSEDDNIVCDFSIQADQARLCPAKQAHDLVLGKIDASLAKKCLTASNAPHLNTKALIQKLDEVAKTVDLDVSTIFGEQMKDPVLSTVRSWIRNNTPPDTKSPEIQQSKGLLRFCQEFNRLLFEEEGQLLCYNEPPEKLEEENLRICLALSLFLACFRLGHYNEMGGHMGANKTYANAKRFYYWPEMFDWICALTADCLTRQNNKPKPKHRNENPLEEWENETVLFCTIHIDHKGPIHPTSSSDVHCLLIFVAISQFLMVYPVRNTTTLATITAVEKWILSFGIPQSIIHDRGTAFINTEFINWTKEFGITLKPRTAYSPWTNGKIETQNQHIARYWRNFLNDAGNNWSSLAPKFAFAHNTSVIYTTRKTPYKIVFGTKPQSLMSLELCFYWNKHKLCCSNFCKDLPSHSHSENSLKNELLDNLLQPQLSQALLEREGTCKQVCSSTFERCREQTTRSHAYRHRFKLGHHLEIGQKVPYENHKRDLTRSRKLQQGRLEPFTVTKPITKITYQNTDDKDPTVIKTVQRNHLVEDYPKEGSLLAMIEEYVPSNHQNDNFYGRFKEQRARDLNNPSITEEHDSFPFPIEPLRSISSTNKPKRSSMHSNASGITSSLASSRTPVLSTPHPSSQHAQTAQLSSREYLSLIQQFIRSSATRMARSGVKSRPKEPKYNRPQPDHPDPQSVLRTRTRQGYKL